MPRGFIEYIVHFSFTAATRVRFTCRTLAFLDRGRLIGNSFLRHGCNEAESILKKLETTREYVSPAELAILYVGLGDKEKALSSLERANAAHDLQMGFLGFDPHYDPLRSEPRFQELIRKVGLSG
jgi:hypothetical protein